MNTTLGHNSSLNKKLNTMLNYKLSNKPNSRPNKQLNDGQLGLAFFFSLTENNHPIHSKQADLIVQTKYTSNQKGDLVSHKFLFAK